VTDTTDIAPGPVDEPLAGDVEVAAEEPTASKPRRKVPLGRIAVIAGVVIVLLGVAAYGAMIANSRWGRRAMVHTGVVGIEALIQGQGDELSAVSGPAVKKQLTKEVLANMRVQGILAEFGKPLWSGNSVVVTATTGMGPGMLVAGASGDGKDVVVFKTSGTVGFTTGAMSLERTWDGWQITGLTVAPTPASTSTTAPSKAPTATP